jgi:hypothetical protein
VDEHVRFPVTLDMRPYTSHTQSNTPDKRDCTYDLFAIVSHVGDNIHKGHYINYAKFNCEWFRFNDHIVEWVSEETVLHSKAYPLVPQLHYPIPCLYCDFCAYFLSVLTTDIFASILNIVWSTNTTRLWKRGKVWHRH